MRRPARALVAVGGLAAWLGLGCGADESEVRSASSPVPAPAVSQSSAAQPSAAFTDIAAQVGLTDTSYSGTREKRFLVEAKGGSAAALFDYDGDGDLDAYQLNGSRLGLECGDNPQRNRLYRNDAGTFLDAAPAAGVDDCGWGMGVAAADYDNDGHLDLHVTNYGGNVLYRGLGDGSFADVTQVAGVVDDRWSTGCSFADYDLDGDLDLYVANYVTFEVHRLPREEQMYIWKGLPVLRGPMSLPGAADVLYRNQGDGTFADVTQTAGVADSARYYGFTAVWGDLDNDGDPDLVVANDSTPNYLYRNDGGGLFSELGRQSGLAYSRDGRVQAGMGCAIADADADGWLDVFLTHFSDDSNTLYRNDGGRLGGRLFFSDVSYPAGVGEASWSRVGWGTGFFDFDLDGDLDLFVANGHVYPEVDRYDVGTSYAQGNQLFANTGGGRFVEVSAQAGSGFQVAKVSRGTAFGDVDGDGDVDIYVANQDDTPTLLRNDSPRSGAWLAVELAGGGVGAVVRVYAGGREQVRQVQRGNSFLSCSAGPLHFGLGESDTVERLEVRWPGGHVDVVRDLRANRRLLVAPGRGVMEVAGGS